MNPPLVSALIANYNHSKYLPQCFGGLQRQTFRDFEIVITDDGSTDESPKLIAQYAARDPRIKAHYFPKNQGVLKAADNVLSRARGTYIFSQGADDFIFDDQFFQRAVDGLRAHPEAAGHYSLYATYSDEANKATSVDGIGPREGYIPPTEFFREFLRVGIMVPGSSSIWRRDLVEAEGRYDNSFGPQVDFVLNHTLGCRHGVVFAKAVSTCMRVFNDARSYTKSGTLWEAIDRFRRIEGRLREVGIAYPEMEEDFRLWRRHWLRSAIQVYG